MAVSPQVQAWGSLTVWPATSPCTCVKRTHTTSCGMLMQAEKAAFEREIKLHTLVHEQLIQFYRGFRHDAHPMAVMVGVVGALAAFYPEVAEVR